MRTFGRYSLSSFLSAVVTAASIVVTIALVLAVAVTVASPWMHLDGDEQLGIPIAMILDEQVLRVRAPSLGPADARVTNVTGTLQFLLPSRKALITPMLMLITILLAAIWVLRELRALFRALRRGQVFAVKNVRHVQRIGWAVILAGPAGATINWLATAYAESHFVAEGLRFTTYFDPNFGMIVSGLVILVIAEVFRAGAKLDEDQSLTI